MILYPLVYFLIDLIEPENILFLFSFSQSYASLSNLTPFKNVSNNDMLFNEIKSCTPKSIFSKSLEVISFLIFEICVLFGHHPLILFLLIQRVFFMMEL